MKTIRELTIEAVRSVGYLPGISDPLVAGANYYEDAPTEWLTSHRRQVREIRKVRPNVVFIGDSITKGWTTEGIDVWRQHFASAPSYCLGLGGDRAQHLLWRIEQGVLDQITPRVIVLMVGVNNLWYEADQFGIDRVSEALLRLGNVLRSKQPDAKIIQLSVLPALGDPNHTVRRHIDAVNQFLRTNVTRFGADFVDLTDIFQDESSMIRSDVMPDLVHPNRAGYALIADRIRPTIANDALYR